MDPQRLRALLEAVEAGAPPSTRRCASSRELPFRELEFAHVDTHRHLRTGFPEVVLGEGKTPEQIAAILVELAKRRARPVLATRVSAAAAHGDRAGGARARATCRCRARSWWARRRRPIAGAASSPW